MKEARRKLICFFVMWKKRHHHVEGWQWATVHARSKNRAEQLLSTQGLWHFSMSLVENKKCDPNKLAPEEHCTHCLVVADVDDDTPLGSIVPNSPEWHERFHSPVRGKISEQRMKEIEKVHERQPEI